MSSAQGVMLFALFLPIGMYALHSGFLRGLLHTFGDILHHVREGQASAVSWLWRSPKKRTRMSSHRCVV